MEYTKLWPGEIAASRLGFGSSQLMGRLGRRESLRALEMALDSGINYVDVARSYGYGEAEQVVGHFLQGKRDRIILATKFGIEVPRTGRLKRIAKALARPVFRALPAVRRMARQRLGAEYQSTAFSPAALRRSLDTSLRNLKTDYVDVYLLHACKAEVFDEDELFSNLRSLVQAGKIRHFGLATDSAVISKGLGSRSAQFEVAQFEFSLLEQRANQLLRNPSASRLIRIAHTLYGGGGGNIDRLRESLARIARDEHTPPGLRAKLSKPSPDIIADAAINAVLVGIGIHIALCSMTKKRHLHQNTNIVGRSIFTEDELGYIRDHFGSSPASPSMNREAETLLTIRAQPTGNLLQNGGPGENK